MPDGWVCEKSCDKRQEVSVIEEAKLSVCLSDYKAESIICTSTDLAFDPTYVRVLLSRYSFSIDLVRRIVTLIMNSGRNSEIENHQFG